jgi:hypothetical protein
MSPYSGFDSWGEMMERFEASEPEPDEVFKAAYDGEGYDGTAEIYYRRGQKYYHVYGSHCSCYGLEGQWDPEEYASRELFLEVLKQKNEMDVFKLVEASE